MLMGPACGECDLRKRQLQGDKPSPEACSGPSAARSAHPVESRQRPVTVAVACLCCRFCPLPEVKHEPTFPPGFRV